MDTSNSQDRGSVTQYELTSTDGTTISARSTSPFSLTLGKEVFSGDNIMHHDTELGCLMTVCLEAIIDGQTTTLSVMLPRGNCPRNAKSIPIRTFSVRTVVHSSIAGPGAVVGQIQEYETQNLSGNAW